MSTGTKMKFSEFIDLLLAQLYALEDADGNSDRFHDLFSIARQLKDPVPPSWVFDAGKVLEAQGLARCVFAMGGVCSAQLTGEGRLFVEQEKGTGVIKRFHESPQNYYKIHVSGDGNQGNVGGNQNISNPAFPIHPERRPAFELLDQIESQIKKEPTLTETEKADMEADIAVVRLWQKTRTESIGIGCFIAAAKSDYFYCRFCR